MTDPDQRFRVEESRLQQEDGPNGIEESLLIASRMTFRERMEWNEAMVALWARWHPDLARRVWNDREAIR